MRTRELEALSKELKNFWILEGQNDITIYIRKGSAINMRQP
jgi:hypothetical protein